MQTLNLHNGTASVRCSSSTSLTTGTWYHVAGTWSTNDNTMRLYINGELDANTGVFTGPIRVSDQDVWLGCDNQPSPFKGIIDEVRLSDTVLEPHEFLLPNVVGHWRFEEGTPGEHPSDVSGSVSDSSFYGNDGTAQETNYLIYSSAIPGIKILPEKLANSVSMDWGSNDQGQSILVPDAGILDVKYAITLEAFINLSNLGVELPIFYKWESTGTESYILRLVASESESCLSFLLHNGATAVHAQSATLLTETATGYHVAGTWSTNDNTMRLYINGELDANTKILSGPIRQSNSVVRIGKNNGALEFHGLIDEARISNVALDPNDFLTAVPARGTMILIK